jgi:hypothetical protein
MTWQEKSVTVNDSKRYRFNSVLGDIIVDEQGIRRDRLKNEDDWDRITSTMKEEEILTGYLPWHLIDEVSMKEDFLSYPHIDITIKDEDNERDWDETVLKLFFKQDAPDGYDQVEKCFNGVRKMWNAYRQNNKLHTLSYDHQDDTHILSPEEGPGEDEEPPEQEPEEESIDDTQEPAEEETAGTDSISEIIDRASSEPDEIMDQFGS